MNGCVCIIVAGSFIQATCAAAVVTAHTHHNRQDFESRYLEHRRIQRKKCCLRCTHRTRRKAPTQSSTSSQMPSASASAAHEPPHTPMRPERCRRSHTLHLQWKCKSRRHNQDCIGIVVTSRFVGASTDASTSVVRRRCSVQGQCPRPDSVGAQSSTFAHLGNCLPPSPAEHCICWDASMVSARSKSPPVAESSPCGHWNHLRSQHMPLNKVFRIP